MPELPEVETIRRGIQPHIENQVISNIVVRQDQLRWKVPGNLSSQLRGKKIKQVQRRGKYLLFQLDHGTLILHLGMSGRLRILKEKSTPNKHDHVDIEFANTLLLRFTDPRRFGALLWTDHNHQSHPLLAKLGPEPLTNDFSLAYLLKCVKNKKTPIKSLIMNNQIVVGVGNIYATESLFLAGIHPLQPAQSVTSDRLGCLVKSIKHVLREAIQQGGTTLKDFINSEGKPGYFAQQLKVYGREGLRCVHCKAILLNIRIGQRSTVYCEYCQAI